jgi:hypothetical protein
MNSITTLRQFDIAFRSGRLIPIVKSINPNIAIGLIPILMNGALLNAFIQDFCQFLNSSNIMLTGDSTDIMIIANYICADQI